MCKVGETYFNIYCGNDCIGENVSIYNLAGVILLYGENRDDKMKITLVQV